MPDFIPQLLVLVGFAGCAAIIVWRAKHLPEGGWQVYFEAVEQAKRFWKAQIHDRFPKEELEARFFMLVEKTLRKLRILVMKIDHVLFGALVSVRGMRTDKRPPDNYWSELARSAQFSTEDLVDTELQLRANPLFASTVEYQKLAEAYLKTNEVGEARRLLIEAWRRAPDDAGVKAQLASVMGKEKSIVMPAVNVAPAESEPVHVA